MMNCYKNITTGNLSLVFLVKRLVKVYSKNNDTEHFLVEMMHSACGRWCKSLFAQCLCYIIGIQQMSPETKNYRCVQRHSSLKKVKISGRICFNSTEERRL